jgi:competence protein ComEC
MAIGGFWKSLQRMAQAERHRWPLWLPIMLGAGAAFYFALRSEPSGAAGFGVYVVALMAAIGAARRGPGRMALALLAALALGFATAKLREESVAAPVLNRALTLHLTGRLLSADPSPRGVRMVVGDLNSGAFVGAAIPAPLASPPGFSQRLGGAIETLRESMTARIRAALPGSNGAIASALITGERGGIEEEDEAALRDAGLAHVLAIAGLHMALVGMGLFWLVRAGLAVFPAIALNHPIKKWAAMAALAGAGFYLLISGASASASRAFVMLAMMLAAILLDRPALSMRNLALAAALLLLLRPESITEPGFQMSFAAVAGLIAVAEWEQGWQRSAPRGTSYRYLRGIALTSLVGSLATIPVAIFTFDRASHYAVLGNLLAMPVMGFWVMPCAALSVIAMPFGLESAPLHVLGWGLDVMLAMGRFVSGLPGAVTMARAFPVGALALMALGGLWLAIWRRAWRMWGVVPIVLGMVWALIAPAPDILVADDARTLAIRGTDGLFYFPRPPKDSFAASRWLARDGDARDFHAALGGGKCDGESCVIKAPDGSLIAAPFRPEALADDCAHAAILISVMPVGNCMGPKLVLDSKTISRDGGYAITNGIPFSVRAWRGERPWSANSAE